MRRFEPSKPKKKKKINCHLRLAHQTSRIKSRSPGSSSSSSFFPEQRACARVLRLSCSARLDSTREAASTIAGYREERTGGVLTPPPAGGAEGGGGVCKGLGTEGGEGAGFGRLNGRCAQPIMGVGIYLDVLDSITH